MESEQGVLTFSSDPDMSPDVSSLGPDRLCILIFNRKFISQLSQI